MTQLHWQFNMFWLADDEWGTWLWTPAGSSAQRGTEPPRTFNHTNVKLIAPGEWWTAIWNDGDRYDLYIDTITPPAVGPDRITMIDLDLDLVRTTTGRVSIEDEDEFEEHRRRYGYPDYVVEKARTVTGGLKTRLEDHDEPFGEVGKAMMQQAQALKLRAT